MEGGLQDGLVLMLIGMGSVFVFLGLLVWMMTLAASFFQKYSHWFPEQKTETKPAVIQDDTAQIAVMIAAIRHSDC